MGTKKSVVFLGSKPIGAACLTHLIQEQHKLNIEIIAVGTKDRIEFSNNNPIRELAVAHNIHIVEHPDDIPNCDIIYSVQYNRILKQHHIEKAKQIAVNLHLAPLPDYRGCNQFSFAIFNGAKNFGVTIHAIDEGVDSGDILFEHRFPMPENIWIKDLLNLSVQQGEALFKETLPQIIEGSYNRQQQVDLVATRGVQIYKRKDIEDLKLIRLDEPKEKTFQRIRATYMPGFEAPYFLLDDKKVYITIE